MKQVIIASDSTCDLSPSLIAQYHIQVIPLSVHLANNTYLDGVDLSADDIYRIYDETQELPKTAAANPAALTDFFAQHTQEGNGLVLFTVSSELSSMYQNAVLAAQAFEDVHVVDSRNLSTGVGIQVLAAAELAQQGLSAGEIAELCRSRSEQVDISFVLDDLEFMQKGGRCSALTLLGANLLSIKPELSVRDGKMGVVKKRRGKFPSALEHYLRDHLSDLSKVDLRRVFVTHAGCEEALVQDCVALVQELAPFQEVHVTRAGCIISSHCGRNTLGIVFLHP